MIELLVALAIIALLLSIVTPRYFSSISKAEEATLAENLRSTRDAIDKHYADTGQYPSSLEELVSKRYLRAIPYDPITQSTKTWLEIPDPDGEKNIVFDIKSGATGVSRDGRTYSEW